MRIETSIHSLRFHLFVQQIASMIPSNRVVFEINEFQSSFEPSALKSMVQQLQELGFLIALDDIGRGHRDLQKLIILDPDYVKLDHCCTNGLATSSKKKKLAQFFVDYCKDEGIGLILEGFEQEDDINVARKLGVKYGQGFLIAKPKPLE